MTVHPLRRRPSRRFLQPAPDGARRVTPVTQIVWGNQDSMPQRAGGEREIATISVDVVPTEEQIAEYQLTPEEVERAQRRAGTTVIVIAEGVAAELQRGAVKNLYAQLRAVGATRATAWMITAGAGLRAGGWRFLTQTAAQHVAATATAGLAVGAAVTTGVVIAVAPLGHGPVVGSPAWHRTHPVHVTLPARPLSYLGAYEQTSPRSYSGMETFAATCGRQPNLALYYSGWYEPFQTAFADAAARHGAIPLVQINPRIGATGAGISLSDIASGTYDNYLVSFADEVASYGHAVIIGFGHEMNGSWYPWGYRRQEPALFVDAWQHIVDVFRMQGADNVTWLWTVNQIGPKTGPLASYWPGRKYVTWVGIDGYYRHPDDTWPTVFGSTIAAVRQVTNDPLLLSETAIGPAQGESWQLDEMYASLRQASDLGLVWYDADTRTEAYRLEDDPRSAVTQQIITAFRELTGPWRLEHQMTARPGK